MRLFLVSIIAAQLLSSAGACGHSSTTTPTIEFSAPKAASPESVPHYGPDETVWASVPVNDTNAKFGVKFTVNPDGEKPEYLSYLIGLGEDEQSVFEPTKLRFALLTANPEERDRRFDELLELLANSGLQGDLLIHFKLLRQGRVMAQGDFIYTVDESVKVRAKEFMASNLEERELPDGTPDPELREGLRPHDNPDALVLVLRRGAWDLTNHPDTGVPVRRYVRATLVWNENGRCSTHFVGIAQEYQGTEWGAPMIETDAEPEEILCEKVSSTQ